MQITVNGQHIAIVDDTLVSNSVNIYECEFEFDASWDGFSKTSVWQLNSDDPIEVVIDSGVAVIPHEVLENAGILRIGVYGTKDEKVMPTVWLEKRKVCLGTPTGSIGTEPTPSIYAQILAVATEAKDIAEEVQTEWESVSANATTLPEGSSATASFDDGVFSFGIPQGERGTDGTDGVGIESILKTSTSGLVDTYTITYTNGTTSTFTVTNGAKGETGNGISNIAKTGTSGLVDTYTITFTNGATTTFTVTNGEKGDTGATGNGIASITKTATVGKVDTYTITYTDGTTTTFDVTNGEVTEASLEEALYDKADVITNTASGSIATFSDGANMPVKSLEVEINAVQSGSGDPSPTNVRPISGWDAVNIVRTGKNLFDYSDSGLTTAGFSNSNGVFTNTFTDTRTSFNFVVQWLNGNTVLGNVAADGSVGRRYAICNITSPVTTLRIKHNGGTRDMRIDCPFTLMGTFIVSMTVTSADPTVVGGLSFEDVMIELGSTATTYEPYNGTTYPISLGQTVYGGVLDVTSGVLTDTHANALYDLGDATWTYYAYDGEGNGGGYTQTLEDVIKKPSTQNVKANVLCSAMAVMSDANFNASSADYRLSVNANGWIKVSCHSATNASTLKTAMSGIKLAYDLATPTEITLSDYPTVETLKGVNNLWADCGDVAVIYRADTKKYIDGTIVDVPLAMIAPIETGTKSSKAYAVGEYFILNGNQFCKAKTAIASGATFTLNTNYTVTTIGAELKALA